MNTYLFALLGICLCIMSCDTKKSQKSNAQEHINQTKPGNIPPTNKQLITAKWNVANWNAEKLESMMASSAYALYKESEHKKKYELNINDNLILWDINDNYLKEGTWKLNDKEKQLSINLDRQEVIYIVKKISAEEMTLETTKNYNYQGEDLGEYTIVTTWTRIKN